MRTASRSNRFHRVTFRELYARARERHQELATLPEPTIEFLSQQARAERQTLPIRDLLIILVVLPVVYVLVGVCEVEAWRLARTLTDRWSRHDFSALLQTVPGLRTMAVFGIFAVFVYFLFMPICQRWLNKLLSKIRMPEMFLYPDMEYSSKKFILTAIVMLWLALGCSILSLASFYQLPISKLQIALRTWLIPPLAILALAPLVFVFLALALVQWLAAEPATTGLTVTWDLLEIMANWPDTGPLDSTRSDFQRETARDLCWIAGRIRRLEFGALPRNASQEWVARQFALASDNLLVCASWLYLPRADSNENVRSRLLVFCNAFLTGNLHDLPREQVAESDGLMSIQRRRRLLRTVLVSGLVFAYCVAPFGLWFILRSRHVSMPGSDSLLLLLYSLWLAIGVFAYLEHTSQSASETLLALVKTVLGR